MNTKTLNFLLLQYVVYLATSIWKTIIFHKYIYGNCLFVFVFDLSLIRFKLFVIFRDLVNLELSIRNII